MSELSITLTKGKKRKIKGVFGSRNERTTTKTTAKSTLEYVFEKNIYKTVLNATKFTVKYFINGEEVTESEFLAKIEKEK
jgi:hypothetical protein